MASTDAQATFAINLQDGVSGPAGSAKQALDGLQVQIDADTRALAGMQKAMKNLQGGAVVNVKQFKDLQAGIASKKAAIAQAQSAFIGLGGQFGKSSAAGRALESRFAALALQARGMPGPLGLVVSKFEAFKSLVGGGGLTLGLIASVAALGLFTAAIGKAIKSLYDFGVTSADARRSELLHLEGLTKIRNWYGIAAGSATEMQSAIDTVSASVSISRDKVAAYAEQLYRAGVRGDNLSQALEGAAIKGSVSDALGQRFAGWAAQIAVTGGSVRALTQDVKARFGGVVQQQMASLTAQTAKMHEGFAALTTGLRVEPLLKGMLAVKQLFTQSTNSGKALRAMVTTMLQPLVDAATAAQPIIKRFFQGTILGALHIGIVLLEVRNWFKRTFGLETVRGLDLTSVALRAGAFAIGLVAGGLVVASVAAAALAVKLTAFLIPALWRLVASTGALAVEGLVIAAPFILGAIAIGAVIAAGYQLYQLWKEIDWTDLGRSIWQGLLSGLAAGKDALLGAVGKLAGGVSDAFRNVLGIHSPSKVFTAWGLAIPAGVQGGIERGTPGARGAARDMIPAPTAPKIPAPAAERATKQGAGVQSRSVHIGAVHLHASPGTDKTQAHKLALDFRRELENVLESVALELGAPIAGATP